MAGLRWLLALAAVGLALTACSSSPAAPASDGGISWSCHVIDDPTSETPSDAARGYGVLSVTITNASSQPWAPGMVAVYMFSSPGVQEGTAHIPDASSAVVAPGATETFTGGNLWPMADTCSVSST